MKTPFEIRFDVLKEARDHLTEEWRRKFDMEQVREERLAGSGQVVPAPTAEEVLDLANQFKKFVDGP